MKRVFAFALTVLCFLALMFAVSSAGPTGVFQPDQARVEMKADAPALAAAQKIGIAQTCPVYTGQAIAQTRVEVAQMAHSFAPTVAISDGSGQSVAQKKADNGIVAQLEAGSQVLVTTTDYTMTTSDAMLIVTTTTEASSECGGRYSGAAQSGIGHGLIIGSSAEMDKGAAAA